MEYDRFKEEIIQVAQLHNEQNQSRKVSGERIDFELPGRRLEAVLYRRDFSCPTVFTAFGGGFVLGGCALDDYMWSELSRMSNVNIISIGYRKAPEHPYPAALEDVYGTVCYFCEHASEYGLDAEKTAVMGASAGGNLALAAALLDGQKHTRHIRTVILNYPYLDLATDPAEKGHSAEERLMYRLFPELYAAGQDLRNPLISPLYMTEEQLRMLPPVYLTAAGVDILGKEAERFAQQLGAAGGKVFFRKAEGMPHGYLEFWFQALDPAYDGKSQIPGMEELLQNGCLETEAEKTCDFIKQAVYREFN